jgi:hypothetical protein
MSINGRVVRLKQAGRYASAQVHFGGERFGQAHEITLAPEADGVLTGTFTVPRRIFDQLAARRREWPIPWTSQDLDTTWLAPERLLLFVQFAEGNDTMQISGMLDGVPLSLKAAYSSTRVHPASFVGFYADLSGIAPDTQHNLKLRFPGTGPAKLLGVFFDNVEPQRTEDTVPATVPE